MRCINKRALCGLLTAALLAVSGCGNKAAEIKNPYPVYSTAVTDSLIAASGEGSNVLSYFATNLCVGGLENTGLENTDEQGMSYKAHNQRYGGTFNHSKWRYFRPTGNGNHHAGNR